MRATHAPSKHVAMQPTPASKDQPKEVQYASATPLSSSGRAISECKVANPSASRRALRFPPTYPQHPVHSTIDASITPALQSVSEWQKRPPVNADGKLAKIVYAMSSNADQETAYHYIPEEVVTLTDWHPFVHASRYRRRALSMEWEGAEKHPHSATSEGEHCLVEAHAVPFYLQHIFADCYGLFEVVTVPLRLLELLLQLQHEWQSITDDKPDLVDFLQRRHKEKMREADRDHLEILDFRAAQTLHTYLRECEVCVVPSVLLMNKTHTANEWYGMLQALETEFKLEVFPRIEVEQKMENKDLYFTALMCSPRRYIPLDMRQDATSMPGDASASCPSSREPQLWRKAVPFVHCRSNGITCPTIVIPSWDDLVQYRRRNHPQSPEEHVKQFVHDMIDLLQEEVTADAWDVEPGQWVFKGLNSTRSNVMRQMNDIDEMAEEMNKAWKKGMKLCAAQPGFLLQPFMKGLCWESRTYFNRGEFQYSLMSDQPPSNRAAPNANNITSAFNTVEVRGHNRISQSEFGYAQAQMVDFCVHILKECEHHCKLVSSSGILRVDLGAEFQKCKGGETEAQLRKKQRNPLLWHITGAGFVVRFFLNEVTSSLDINWFSQQTNYPIVYEAAYVTSQLLLELISKRPIKQSRTVHGTYLLDPRCPEPPLPDGEVRRQLDHVCEFQCRAGKGESARQQARDKKHRRKDKAASRREREKPRHRQNPDVILSDDEDSPSEGEEAVVVHVHRPVRYAPEVLSSRLRPRRRRGRDESDDEQPQRRRPDAMHDDGPHANSGTRNQDEGSNYSASDRGSSNGDDGDEPSSSGEREDDEVMELPAHAFPAARSSSHLNGKLSSVSRNSSSRSSRSPPRRRHNRLRRPPPHDEAGITCISSESDESEDLTIGDEVTDEERKRMRRQHNAEKQMRLQRESTEAIEVDGD